MAPTIDTVPRPEWSALPHEGARGVEGKVLLREEKLLLALLRFGRDATIHEHAGESEAIVVCLEGDGYTSVENESARLQAGQRVRWPAGTRHRLWTEGSTMLTLMVERPSSGSAVTRLSQGRD